MSSIGEAFDKYPRAAPGFDLLRVLLSLAIVVWHSFGIARGGFYIQLSWFLWFPGYGMLVMFFALSGFLITASAQRWRLGTFLINRGLRIVPALAVEICLSAFILGAIFTILPVSDYLTHPQTYQYLTNIVGLINYQLPGVFVGNTASAVNWSLWTIPHEIVCYLIMSALIIAGAVRSARVTFALTSFFIAAGLCFHFILPVEGDTFAGELVNFLFLGQGSRLYVGFLLGIFAFQMRYRIAYRWPIFWGCMLLFAVLGAAGPSDELSLPLLSLIAAPALVYVTLFIGVTPVPPLPLFRHGDYSYGIYLYGMPLQQATAATFPWVESPIGQVILAMPTILIFSAMSWHFVELPINQTRKRLLAGARHHSEQPVIIDEIPPEAAAERV